MTKSQEHEIVDKVKMIFHLEHEYNKLQLITRQAEIEEGEALTKLVKAKDNLKVPSPTYVKIDETNYILIYIGSTIDIKKIKVIER